jgi:hypothetical protein
MFRTRYVAPVQKPEPKPMSQLTRPQLAARVHQLRQALDLLWSQSEADGGMPYRTIGTAKVELIGLEQKLRELDTRERGERLSTFARDLLTAPLEVQLAAVGRRQGQGQESGTGQ